MGVKMDCMSSQFRQGIFSHKEDALNEEERIIEKQERLLGFHNHSCKKVDGVFNKFRIGDSLTANQFSKIVKVLHLQTDQVEIQQFYRSYHNTQKNIYSAFELQQIAIYLSKGSSFEKAVCLFDLIDKEAFDQITVQQYSQSLVLMYKFIIENSLLLCEGVPPEKMTKTKVLILQEEWKLKFNQACEQITQSVFFKRKILTKEDFVDILGGQYPQFTTTRGLRYLLFTIEINNKDRTSV